MQRYRQYGQLDDNPEVFGDTGFNRLDMLTDPARLPQGSLAVSENLRFDSNGTIVRGGLARLLPAGQNLGPFWAADIYRPNGGNDTHALVTRKALILFDPTLQTVNTFYFPAGETVEESADVSLIQAGVANGTTYQLYILRGLEKSVLYFDGATVTVDSDIPESTVGLYYQDRIAVAIATQDGASAPQGLSVSAFDDFTTFKLLSQFQVLIGGNDYIVGAMPYQGDYVLLPCRQKWMVAFFDPQTTEATGDGYTGELAADTSFMRELTREAGAVGPRAFIEALGLIWFVSDAAVYAFRPNLNNELTVLGRPVSADIQPIMDRLSTDYAAGVQVARYGYRLYFAMPISDEPVNVTAVTVNSSGSSVLRLPFTLPATLTSGALVQFTTEEPHNLNSADTVLISLASDPALNGQFQVASVVDAYNFVVGTPIVTSGAAGINCIAQKIATRNNRIAVLNLNNMRVNPESGEQEPGAWESIDTLPAGFYADFLRVSNFGSRLRLWVVDQNAGPALYEQNAADDAGNIVGGVQLPATLPFTLNAANYAAAPIPGHFITRSMRWGFQGSQSGGYTGTMTQPAAPRQVKRAEVRATFDTNSDVSVTLNVQTPNTATWSQTKEYNSAQMKTLDAPLRVRCGKRGLEAQVEVKVNTGRPIFRSVAVETIAVGRVEED